MSDTPRTDRAWVCVKREHRQDPTYYAAVKLLHEAQAMERELTAITTERDKLKRDNERLLAHMARMYEGCPWETNAGDDVDELFQVAGKLLKELDNY